MILRLLLILLLIPSLSWGADKGGGACDTCADTNWSSCTAADAEYETISTCVTNAARNATITIPEDSANWNDTTMTITKGIWLKGAGVGKTVITNARGMLIFNADETSVNDDSTVFKVTGIEFIGTSGEFHIVTGTDGNLYKAISNHTQTEAVTKPITGSGWTSYWAAAPAGEPANHVWTVGATYELSVTPINIYNSYAEPFEKIIIGDCKFTNWGNGIFSDGHTYGVIYGNIFADVHAVVRNMGNDYTSWSTQTQEYGTGNNLYFEDNYIYFLPDFREGNYQGWIETGQGGRIAVRYNTWDYTNVDGASIWVEVWDVHGLQNPTDNEAPFEGTCTGYSSMVTEYYGNSTSGVGIDRWMYHRGGWLLMFYNAGDGTSWHPNPNSTTQYYCDTCANQGSYKQKSTNMYAWRNLLSGTEKKVNIVSSSPGCETDPIVENTDLFNYNASFDGTSGMGCGALAARPATCTAGVGYWATAQSCSDLTGLVGRSPSTPISGKLYKCTATDTWTDYYTPYQYPHPLRNAGARANFGSGSTHSFGSGATHTFQ